jgi:putative addiction module component (TIGR02574 family)
VTSILRATNDPAPDLHRPFLVDVSQAAAILAISRSSIYKHLERTTHSDPHRPERPLLGRTTRAIRHRAHRGELTMTYRRRRQPMFTSSALHYDVPMGNDARTLLTEALELAADDRAELAAELLASLDDPASDSQEEVDRLWAAEIERRSNRVLSGESPGEPWDEARRRIESDLAAR